MPSPLRFGHIELDGVDITFARSTPVSSPSATLVWLHGLGGASTIQFAPFAAASDLGAVASLLIDLPGFGRSSAASCGYEIEEYSHLVAQLIRSLVNPPVVLFGHSMGGSIAILTARSLEDDLAGLIVAEPNLVSRGGSFSQRITSMSERAWLDHGHRAMLRTVGLSARTDATAAIFFNCLKMASPIALYRSATSLVAPRSPEFGAVLETLPLPRTLIAGQKTDDEFRIPNLTTHIVPDAGHIMMSDNPTGFVSALAISIAPLLQ